MPVLDDEDEDVAALVRATMLSGYSSLMAATILSPLDAIEAMAEALGSLYRDMAQAHTHPPTMAGHRTGCSTFSCCNVHSWRNAAPPMTMTCWTL